MAKYKEIKLLYRYCLSLGISNAKLIKHFDGYAIIFININKCFSQHSFVPGAVKKGLVEPAIGCVGDYKSLSLERCKTLVLNKRKELLRGV